MKHRSILLFVVTAFLISGCTAKTPEPTQESTPVALKASPKAVTEPSASELLGQKLKKEMAYEDLRKTVLADGWLPLVTPECKENVGGEAKICDQQPEVEACSGDGHCNMLFAHNDGYSKLKVGTYGGLVKFFEFSTLPIDNAAIACPSLDFEEFLKSFAKDKNVQTAFTQSLVKVTKYIDDDEKGYVESTIYFEKSDYHDFFLSYVKNNFFVVDSAGTLSPAPVFPEIKHESNDAYMVKLPDDPESSSYRFRKKNGCWHLAEDPEPAAS